MARAVRQHCGFGCAICGVMPTEIEHIEPFSEVQKHEFGNLVLLCSRCHREVTSKRIGKRRVAHARCEPYCKRNRPSTYQMYLEQQSGFKIGKHNVHAEDDHPIVPVSLGGFEPIKFLLKPTPIFSLRINGPDGELAISVTENTFDFRPGKFWDVKLSGTRLEIRWKRKFVLLKATVREGILVFHALRVSANGLTFCADKTGTVVFPGNILLGSGNIGVSRGFPAFALGEKARSTINVNLGRATDEEAWRVAEDMSSQKIQTRFSKARR
nr:HNH endonuclease signature motif containing protein [Roseobacter litoralis]